MSSKQHGMLTLLQVVTSYLDSAARNLGRTEQPKVGRKPCPLIMIYPLLTMNQPAR